MSKRDDLLLIEDIVASFKALKQYTAGMEYEDFLNNRMCVDAVIRNFEIIGEAANYVSNDFKDKHQQIVWRKMVDFRNRLIHDYFGVSYKIDWNIIENEVHDYIKILENLKN